MKATIAGRISAILVVCALGAALVLASCTKPESEYITDTTRKESAIWRTRTLTETVVEYIEVPVEIVVEKEVPTWVSLPQGEDANRYSDINLSLNDIELLAKMAWREARGEKQLGMRMVIEVTLNRVLSEHFPDTVYGVLYQPGQYAPSGEAPELDDITPTQEQYDAVYTVLRETPITEPDVLFFATTPLYGEIFMRVGGHYFTHYPEEW